MKEGAQVTRNDQERITSELDHLTPSATSGTLGTVSAHQRRVSRGTNRRAGQTVYCYPSERAGIAYSRTGYATAAREVANPNRARSEPAARTGALAEA